MSTWKHLAEKRSLVEVQWINWNWILAVFFIVIKRINDKWSFFGRHMLQKSSIMWIIITNNDKEDIIIA